jgi:hypothetical protein
MLFGLFKTKESRPYAEINTVIAQHEKSDPRFADELRIMLCRQQEEDERKQVERQPVSI